MNIEIIPLVDLNSVHDEICDHDGCGYRPEIGINIYKRKEITCLNRKMVSGQELEEPDE